EQTHAGVAQRAEDARALTRFVGRRDVVVVGSADGVRHRSPSRKSSQASPECRRIATRAPNVSFVVWTASRSGSNDSSARYKRSGGGNGARSCGRRRPPTPPNGAPWGSR